jgi:high-affinity nickel-transport protein
MLATDGLNGLWIARLLRGAGPQASLASRLLCAVVGGLGLLVAAWEFARMVLPQFAAWSDGQDVLLGVVVVGTVLAASWLLKGLRNLEPNG